MKTILLKTVLIMLAWASFASAQIKIDPVTPLRDQPIVAVLENVIPEGAQVQGGWSTSTASWRKVGVNTVHVWAGPGEHKLSFRGIWIKTRPITIEGQEVQVLEGFGFVDETASFTVGGTGPDPQPPPPGGDKQLMLFYDASQLDDMPELQRQLLTSRVVRERLKNQGHVLLEVLESAAIRSGVPADYKPWMDAVAGDPLPRVALAPKEGGPVKDYPLPANVDLLMTLVEGP